MSSTTTSTFLIFTLFSILPAGSTTGHLSLELTASHDCALQLSTPSVSETLNLPMGSTITSSFHPTSAQLQKVLTVDFKMIGGTSKDQAFETYHLRVQGASNSEKTFIFGSVVVIVQSKFECDQGFTGVHCEDLVTSTTFTTTTTTTTTTSPSTVRVPVPTAAAVSKSSSSTSTLIIIILSLIVLGLVILIAIVWILMSRRGSHIYMEPTQTCVEKNPEDLYATIQKTPTGSPRYAPQPYTSVPMTPC